MPREELPSVHHLPLQDMSARGLKGIIFDLDNTLGSWGFTELDPRTTLLLDQMSELGFKLAYLSNHDGRGREALARQLGRWPVVWSAGKPFRSGFDRVLGALGVQPREVAMVGDRLVTDIWGANRLGLHTILVEPIVHVDEGFVLRTKRGLERFSVRVHRRLR